MDVKRGRLHELVRKGLGKKWEERYFEISNGLLRSFASEASQEAKANISLDGAQVFRATTSELSREFVITILPTRDEHTHSLACNSEQECKEWLEALLAHSQSQIVLAGTLLKCDSGFKKWAQRHFVLTKRSLMYFKTPDARVPQAEIDLRLGGDIVPNAEVRGHLFAFSITPIQADKTGQRRTYILVADSDKDRGMWVAALRSVLPVATSRFNSTSRPRSLSAEERGSVSGVLPMTPRAISASDLATSTAAVSPDSCASSSFSSSFPTSPISSPSTSPRSSTSIPSSPASTRKPRSNSIVMFATKIANSLSSKPPLARTASSSRKESFQIQSPSPFDDDRQKVDDGSPWQNFSNKDDTALSSDFGVIAQGILNKRSPKKTILGMYIWKLRLVTLERDDKGVHIKYFKPEQPGKPLGVIPHKLVESVDILDVDLQRFDIVTKKRTFHLRGIEEGDLDLWVSWFKQLQITSASKTLSGEERSEEANEDKTRKTNSPTQILHQGYLAKKSPKGIGVWQKRFFVLTEARLTYYKSQDTTIPPLGMIILSSLEQVTVIDQNQGVFCLEYGAGRKMMLTILKPSAVDRVTEGGWHAAQKLEEQLSRWLDAFMQARSITVKKEFQPVAAEMMLEDEEDDDSVANKRDMMRYRVVQELLASERSYIKQLECALDVYMKPMTEVGVLNEKINATLFSNLPTILPLNRLFLEAVENRVEPNVWKIHPKIGDIFLEFAPFFKLYAEYARSNQAASELLGQLLSANNKFVKYHDTHAPLASLLITPIQRVPRYQLLLKEILKHTSESHDDRVDCEKALDAITALAASVNDCIKERQLADFVIQLEAKFTTSPGFVDPGRVFVMQGPLTKFSRNDQPTLYEFFLFNDMLAYAASRADGKFRLKHKLMINEHFGAEDTNEGDLNFSVQSQEKTFKVSAPDEARKKQWLQALDECINNEKSKHRRPQDGSVRARPLWKNNEDCRCCRKKFTVLLHRYHCASCGWSVCAKCSPHRLNDERCCARCHSGVIEFVPESSQLSASELNSTRKNSAVEESDEEMSEDEAGWVNPFAVFASRMEDLEEKSVSSDRKHSRSNSKPPKKEKEKEIVSLTYFAFANAPKSFESASRTSHGEISIALSPPSASSMEGAANDATTNALITTEIPPPSDVPEITSAT